MDAQAQAISLDVLAESLNLGLGHVIEELAEISNSKIELHVPEVNMVPKNEALTFTSMLRSAGKAIFVQQRFSGEITGEALLFFSEEESLNLLNGLLSENEQSLIEFAATEEEMLLDLTNVAVSGVIYALSNLLGIRLNTELPRCEYGYFDDICGSTSLLDDADDMVLFLTISFTVVKKNSRAQLMFFQPRDTLEKLYDHIQKRLGL
ncbi:hypothetical protein [Oceanobacter mangrovi]|uniref:hypothetical protein n=1 Tax=Oceanobacter mangrovi TaxID=2862510 RepID=UPI001C8D39E9|nr:hypothetical protein [Oceanobacter mangrovi]